MNNQEVAHLWANQGREKATGSHFYFEGVRLYSYGRHYCLGKLFPDGHLALINSRGYSVTTAKHIGYARGALSSSWRVVDVPNPDVEFIRGTAGSLETHKDNLADMVSRMSELVMKATRARLHASSYLEQIEKTAADYAAYVAYFKLKRHAPKLHGIKDADKIIKKAKATQAEAKAARARYEEKRRADEAEALARWRNGESVQNSFSFSNVALRVSADGKRVETNKGAAVDLSAASRLYRIWKAQVGYLAPGLEIGPYKVDYSTAEYVKIGCHRIEAAEFINFFENVLKIKA